MCARIQSLHRHNYRVLFAAFGPFYFLRFGFYVEALVFFALAYVTFGASNLLAPIFVGGAWRRCAVKRADMKNIETVIRLTIKE